MAHLQPSSNLPLCPHKSAHGSSLAALGKHESLVKMSSKIGKADHIAHQYKIISVVTCDRRPKHATKRLYQIIVAIMREQVKFSANWNSLHVNLYKECLRVTLMRFALECAPKKWFDWWPVR